MNTTSLAVILSVLSLGGVAVLYVKVDDLSEQMKMTRVDDGSTRTAAADSDPEYVIRKGDGLARTEPAGTDAMEKTEPADAGEPLSVEERLAKLEKKEAERSRTFSPRAYRMPKFVRDVDDLGKQLKLTANQKDRIRSAVDRGKARIEEVLSIPGSDGKTIKELREESRRKIQEAIANPEKNAGNLVTFAMMGHKRMGEKIPGRNETYRQEIDRIKKETRDEINGTLNAEQQEQFKDTQIDPMLGDTGGRVAFSTSISVGDEDGEAPVGGFMIAEDVSVETSSEPTESGKKDE
ncbi:MAG: hypothetical protein ACYTHK_18720 [Planctomycetota bacterium]